MVNIKSKLSNLFTSLTTDPIKSISENNNKINVIVETLKGFVTDKLKYYEDQIENCASTSSSSGTASTEPSSSTPTGSTSTSSGTASTDPSTSTPTGSTSTSSGTASTDPSTTSGIDTTSSSSPAATTTTGSIQDTINQAISTVTDSKKSLNDIINDQNNGLSEEEKNTMISLISDLDNLITSFTAHLSSLNNRRRRGKRSTGIRLFFTP